MKKIKPILAKKQPLIWKQAISNAEHRGHTLRNLLLKPLIDKKFSFKNHQTYFFDHLIIGSNPILTYLLMLKLHDFTLRLDANEPLAEPLSVGVLLIDELDYWAYHTFEKTDIWNYLKLHYKINYGLSFQDMLNTRNILFFNDFIHECIFINSHNFDILNCRYDQPTNGYILHVGDKKEKQISNNFQPNMPTILQREAEISNKYKVQLYDYCSDLSVNMHGNFRELTFPNKKTSCIDSQYESHILIAQKVWLTSQPQTWLEYEPVSDDTCTFRNQKMEEFKDTRFLYKTLPNIQQHIFGTADHIANDFYGLEEQSLYDVIKILKTNITD